MLYDDIENKSVFIYAMPSMYHHHHQKKSSRQRKKKKLMWKMNQRNFNSENQIKKKELKCSKKREFARCVYVYNPNVILYFYTLYSKIEEWKYRAGVLVTHFFYKKR